LSAEPNAIRAFVAIAVPDDLLDRLAAVQGELKTVLPRHRASWTKPEHLHLTLRFLGNVAPPDIPRIEAQLRSALSGFGELELACARLGYFPDARRPQVIWAGVQDAAGRLPRLHERVDAAVREFADKPAEARFVGHITLARPRQLSQTDTECLERFLSAEADRGFGGWRAREVILWRSELSPAGARYHELARIPLG
jgi:RNA 2',3'-cyclic 3'-phosphodiesterase